MKYWGRKPVEEDIAVTIITAIAIVGTAIIYPTDRLLTLFLGDGKGSYLFRKSDFNREAKRLQKRGYVALTKSGGGWKIKILARGRDRYEEIKMSKMRLPRERTWDGRWRMYVFDIPEDYRSARNQLRKKLKDLGMYNMQRSVFVYPYDCRKELDYIGGYFRVDKYTTYAEVSYSDADKELRNFFRASKLI